MEFRPTQVERLGYFFQYFIYTGSIPVFLLSFFLGFQRAAYWALFIGVLCILYFLNVIPFRLYEICLTEEEIWAVDQSFGRFLFPRQSKIKRIRITEKLRIYYRESQSGWGRNRRNEFILTFVPEDGEHFTIAYENMKSLERAYKEIQRVIFANFHLNSLVELIEMRNETYLLGEIGISESLLYLVGVGYKWGDIKEVVVGETVFEREWVIYFKNDLLKEKRLKFPEGLKEEEYKFIRLLEYKLIKEDVKYRLEN